jgi:LysM repeat protein
VFYYAEPLITSCTVFGEDVLKRVYSHIEMDISKIVNLQNILSLIIGGCITFLITLFFYRKRRLLLRYRLLSPIDFKLPDDVSDIRKKLRIQTLILNNSSAGAINNIQIKISKNKLAFLPKINLPSDRYSTREYEDKTYIEINNLLVSEEAEISFFLANNYSLDDMHITSGNARPINIEKAYSKEKYLFLVVTSLLALSTGTIIGYKTYDILPLQQGSQLQEIKNRILEQQKEAHTSGRITSYILSGDLPKKMQKLFKDKPYTVKIHEVEPNDTLYDVATKYKTSREAIEIANDIKDDSLLFLRRYLIVPTESSDENIEGHRQEGDKKK